jgi:hypothetical protein
MIGLRDLVRALTVRNSSADHGFVKLGFSFDTHFRNVNSRNFGNAHLWHAHFAKPIISRKVRDDKWVNVICSGDGLNGLASGQTCENGGAMDSQVQF